MLTHIPIHGKLFPIDSHLDQWQPIKLNSVLPFEGQLLRGTAFLENNGPLLDVTYNYRLWDERRRLGEGRTRRWRKCKADDTPVFPTLLAGLTGTWPLKNVLNRAMKAAGKRDPPTATTEGVCLALPLEEEERG